MPSPSFPAAHDHLHDKDDAHPATRSPRRSGRRPSPSARVRAVSADAASSERRGASFSNIRDTCRTSRAHDVSVGSMHNINRTQHYRLLCYDRTPPPSTSADAMSLAAADRTPPPSVPLFPPSYVRPVSPHARGSAKSADALSPPAACPARRGRGRPRKDPEAPPVPKRRRGPPPNVRPDTPIDPPPSPTGDAAGSSPAAAAPGPPALTHRTPLTQLHPVRRQPLHRVVGLGALVSSPICRQRPSAFVRPQATRLTTSSTAASEHNTTTL